MTHSSLNNVYTFIPATFRAVEHGNAILVTEDGQEIKVAKEVLQPLPEAGSSFELHILPAEEAALQKNELAKAVLNQILGNDS